MRLIVASAARFSVSGWSLVLLFVFCVSFCFVSIMFFILEVSKVLKRDFVDQE